MQFAYVSKSILGLVLVALSLSTFVVFSKDSAVVKDSLISIEKNPGYTHILSSLGELVQSSAKQKVNNFFIARDPEGAKVTYMLWREKRVLWILSLDGNNAEHWSSVIQFPRASEYIELDTNVVATQKDIGTSSYLVDKPWVSEKIYDAVVNGDIITIEKK